jgi:hydrogenase nickel incorporation protein HypB
MITKVDLAEAAGFERHAAIENIARVRPGIEVIETSARTGVGMTAWLQRIASHLPVTVRQP